MDPLVSVVIPVYNAARYVAQAVDSVLDQTYAPLQVIVVNDGSTDDTATVLEPYLDRIEYCRQENRGASASRNRGIELAKGKYIAFLDADDLWTPEKISRQVRVLEDNPQFGLVHSDTAVIDESGAIMKPSANRLRQVRNGNVFEEFFSSDISVVLTSAAMVRKECFEKVPGFDGRFPVLQDYGLFLSLSWHFHVWYIDEPLAQYRITPGSLSRTYLLGNISDRETILREAVAEHPEFFAERREWLRQRWSRFYLDAAFLLFHHREYSLSHGYFRKALRAGPSAWMHYLLTLTPEPLLRRLAQLKHKLTSHPPPQTTS
ncbi:MAG: glycosyltransferase [Lentisphaerae bacterium]|nr:glycosyltransferase [Lentisphaerota bacterium]